MEDEEGFWLEIDMPESGFVKGTEIKGTSNLAPARLTEGCFENADGSSFVIDKDFNGVKRSENPTVGPFENLKPGKNIILVWKNRI